jgi:cupin 2 domain-containing protein
MIDNIFENALPSGSGELSTELFAAEGLRIERIISYGEASPPGFWYDQPLGEWVLLLEGSAGLRFEDEPSTRQLCKGDCLYIAAHRRHRVDWTQAGAPTIWLAVHHDRRPRA